MANFESLLEPISAEEPCGPDLEYDSAFLELDSVARGKPEQQFGDTVVPAEEPDWRDVGARTLELLGRSKDLRVVALFLRAQTRLYGLSGCLEGFRLLNGLLERYWDSLHPMLDVEDDNDPTMRLNALAPLVDLDSLPRDIREASLVPSKSASDRLTVRDAEVAMGKLQPKAEQEAKSDAEIDAVIQEAYAESPEGVKAALEFQEIVKRTQSLLSEKAPSHAPDLSILKAIAYAASQVINRVLSALEGGATEEGNGSSDTGDEARGGPRRALTGDITNRGDAIKAIDKICEYLQRTEPTNPAPLLLQRAKRLMTLNFIDLIAELAPDSLGRIKDLTGYKDEEE